MKIAVDQAQEGMVLSAAVVDAKGRLIMPKGEKLTAHVIGRLARFGVAHVDVEAPAAEASASTGDAESMPEPRPAGLDEAALTAQIHARFASVSGDERMVLIRDAVTRQLVRSGVAKPI